MGITVANTENKIKCSKFKVLQFFLLVLDWGFTWCWRPCKDGIHCRKRTDKLYRKTATWQHVDSLWDNSREIQVNRPLQACTVSAYNNQFFKYRLNKRDPRNKIKQKKPSYSEKVLQKADYWIARQEHAKFPKNSTISLSNKFIVRQVEHERATPEQIDECHEREIRFVVTDKCAIYLLIYIAWLSWHTIDANEENGKLWFRHAAD